VQHFVEYVRLKVQDGREDGRDHRVDTVKRLTAS